MQESNPTNEPECVVVEPEGIADAAVIWLHGLGADGRDFLPILPHLGLPPGHGVRFLFPNAPVRPVTANGGWPMPAWYDIEGFDFPRRIDAGELAQAENSLRGWIAGERERGIASTRMVLAGFSQGGAVALHTGLRYREEALAGILALSCYLPVAPGATEVPAHSVTPILLAHGEQDEVVPLAEAVSTRERLRGMGLEPGWHTWPMGHEVISAEVRVIGAWLRRCLSLE
jgi:phospholipase/carboxylesterase